MITWMSILLYLQNYHEKKQIIGSYDMILYDYSNPNTIKDHIFYPFNVLGLCMDKENHYAISYPDCFFPDPIAPVIGFNYLSAGKYYSAGYKVVLIDQWNQTRIELLKRKDTLIVLKGYRSLIGKYFSKEEDHMFDVEPDDFYCGEDWFFREQHNKLRIRYDSIHTLSQKERVKSIPIHSGHYKGTSDCDWEHLILKDDHSFKYKITDGYFFTFIALKGKWRQEGNFIILKDSLVNNSYYLEFIYDTLRAGFNLPGSSNIRGQDKYLLSFIRSFKNE